MKCPTCGAGEHRVLRTDELDDRIVRTRQCETCGGRWRTAEVPAVILAAMARIRAAWDALGKAFASGE